MYKIVKEFQQVYTEILVEADSEEEAYLKADRGEGVEIDVMPVFINVLKREVRNIIEKDRRDPVFMHAMNEIEYQKDLVVREPDEPVSFLEELVETIR